MSTLDARSLPLDPTSSARLGAAGLDYRRVDADGADFEGFTQAVTRGFLGAEYTQEQVGASREAVGKRRMTGIYDPASVHPAVPVATVESWVTALTMERDRTIPMWAITGVTVAPTHRRQGIATAMLEGELRTAAAAGVAIAGLTVSEATIYGRFGFAPAVFVTDWTIETRRARWIGPRVGGRLDAVNREVLRDRLAQMHERVRHVSPGQVEGWPGLWRRTAGLTPGQDDGTKIRGVQYSDDDGTVRGVLAYSLSEDAEDYSKHELRISALIADGEEAYAALWRFALEHDLVSVVKADLRSTAEPLRWMIADQRAAVVRESDHEWLRILDLPAVLSARSYRRADSFVLRVTDPLGFADGTWRLVIDGSGTAEVAPTGDAPDATLTVGAIGAVLLGGVRASTLRAAGVVDADEAVAARIDAVFAAVDSPRLSIWY